MAIATADLWSVPFLLAALLLVTRMAPAPRSAMLVVSIALAARSALVVVDAVFGPVVEYDPDWSVLRTHAGVTLEHGLASGFTTGRLFFGWLVGSLWIVTGTSVIVVNAVNAVIGSAIVYVTYRLTLELWGSARRATTAAAIVAVFPTLLIYASQPSREPLIALGAVSGLLFLVRWYRSGSPGHLVGTFASLVVAGIIHSAFGVVMVIAAVLVAAEILRPRLHFRRAELAANAAAALIVLGAASAVLGAGIGLDKVGNDPARIVTLAQLERTTTVRDIDNRTAYLTRAEIAVTSFWDVAAQYPRRLALFLFAPFPHQVREATDAVGLVVSGFVLVVLLRLAVTLRSVTTSKGGRAGLLFVVVSVALFAWGTVNYGTATRHKSKLVPIAAALLVAPRRIEDPRS